MRGRCANCDLPMVVPVAAAPDEGPHHCDRCIAAITLVVDVIASRIAAAVVRGMADEVGATGPAVEHVGGGEEDGALDLSSAAPSR